MKYPFAFAAVAAVLAMPVSMVQADAASDYRLGLQCASFHVIGSVILSESDANSPAAAAELAKSGEFAAFAESVNPTANAEADFDAQMEADVAVLTDASADVNAFLSARAAMCKDLEVRL